MKVLPPLQRVSAKGTIGPKKLQLSGALMNNGAISLSVCAAS
jgi:hypothetical protein